MKRLNQNKQLIDTAIAARAQPRQRGKQTILPTGQRRDTLGQPVLVGEATKRNSSYVVLANNLGIVTSAGEHYYEKKRPEAAGRIGVESITGLNSEERLGLHQGRERATAPHTHPAAERSHRADRAGQDLFQGQAQLLRCTRPRHYFWDKEGWKFLHTREHNTC